mgnify:CR=1 FL=1
MRAINQVAPIDLRVNTLQGTKKVAKSLLAQDNILVEETPISTIGLRTLSNKNILQSKAFKSGLIEVQDEGSQIISLLTDVNSNMDIIDFCAGAG